MLVDQATLDRGQRHDRWYGLLQQEIELCGTNAKIVAVSNVVAKYLKRRVPGKPLTRVINYSGQVVSARQAMTVAHTGSSKPSTLSVPARCVGAAEDFLRTANVPVEFREQILSRSAKRSRLAKSQLTVSQQQLIFHYKLKFESMRS